MADNPRIQTESRADISNPLTTSVEPSKTPKGAGKGEVGDTAVMDAVIIIVICWLIVFGIAGSLRHVSI